MIKGLETISLLLIVLANTIFISLVYKWSNYQMMTHATCDFGSADSFTSLSVDLFPRVNNYDFLMHLSTRPLCVCKVQPKIQHHRTCTFLFYALTLIIPKETAQICANIPVVPLPSLRIYFHWLKTSDCLYFLIQCLLTFLLRCFGFLYFDWWFVQTIRHIWTIVDPWGYTADASCFSYTIENPIV